MPKTINLPEELATDKILCPKVIVIEEYEQRKENGDLKIGVYKFKWGNAYYKVVYYDYKHRKANKSELYKII